MLADAQPDSLPIKLPNILLAPPKLMLLAMLSHWRTRLSTVSVKPSDRRKSSTTSTHISLREARSGRLEQTQTLLDIQSVVVVCSESCHSFQHYVH